MYILNKNIYTAIYQSIVIDPRCLTNDVTMKYKRSSSKKNTLSMYIMYPDYFTMSWDVIIFQYSSITAIPDLSFCLHVLFIT